MPEETKPTLAPDEYLAYVVMALQPWSSIEIANPGLPFVEIRPLACPPGSLGFLHVFESMESATDWALDGQTVSVLKAVRKVPT